MFWSSWRISIRLLTTLRILMFRLEMKIKQYYFLMRYQGHMTNFVMPLCMVLTEPSYCSKCNLLHKIGAEGQDPVPKSLSIKKFKGQKFVENDQESSEPTTTNQKETRSCHWCKKLGQLKKDCFAWKRKQANGEGKGVNSTDCVEENETPDALYIMEIKDEGSLIMDSGCSFHMSPNLKSGLSKFKRVLA